MSAELVMIRFTETNKWHDPWFMGLKHGSKLLFFYIIENCDNAGFYEINEKLLLVSLDITAQQFRGALKGLERGLEGPCDGWLRVKNFLKHQKNAHLNPANPAHKQIIALLEVQIRRFPEVKSILPETSPLVGASKGLGSPIGTGTGTGTGQRKKGEPEGEGRNPRPKSQEEVLAYCKSIDLPETDADYFWHKWLGNGFKNNKSPMRDWQAVIRSWKDAGHCPSQKNAHQRNRTSGARNTGTSNEGHSGQYKGVGRVQGVPNPQRPAVKTDAAGVAKPRERNGS